MRKRKCLIKRWRKNLTKKWKLNKNLRWKNRKLLQRKRKKLLLGRRVRKRNKSRRLQRAQQELKLLQLRKWLRKSFLKLKLLSNPTKLRKKEVEELVRLV